MDARISVHSVSLQVAFLAGYDSDLHMLTWDPHITAHRHRLHLHELQESFTALEKCPQPIIIAVHGACVGGGMDLACCCDIRLASEQAWFTIKEVDIGLCADLGQSLITQIIFVKDTQITPLFYEHTITPIFQKHTITLLSNRHKSISPRPGTLQRLPKTVGNASLVRELAYTARRFGAEEAKTFGFLSRVFKDKVCRSYLY